MWFIKLCLFNITLSICQMTGQHGIGLIIIFAYIFEIIKDILGD